MTGARKTKCHILQANIQELTQGICLFRGQSRGLSLLYQAFLMASSLLFHWVALKKQKVPGKDHYHKQSR